MQYEQAKKLLEKFEDGTISEQEMALLDQWYLNWPTDQTKPLSENEISHELVQLRNSVPNLVKAKKISLFLRIAVAASLLIGISIGAYYWVVHSVTNDLVKTTKNIHPGANTAILTLANGTTIRLDSAKKGELTTEGSASIKKATDGTIVYDLNILDAGKDKALNYNSIKTPKGGQYKVILSDGTLVWLNADSYIRFPSSFASNERRVEIGGEAYFEVAKDKNKPFKVVSRTQTIEVLGTHFDVNSYADEETAKTTLIEGSVKLNNQIILKPGEQSQLKANTIKIAQVDVNNAIAWKDGKFRFENENIKDLMRQISRWYNVEVVFEGEVTHQEFSGSVSRFDEIAKVLDLLQSTNTVHFKVEGRRIIVKP